MKLLKLKAEGFGPLRGEWAFAPDKLNLVVDENERGKSSLLAAITAALYGLDDDRRTHRVLTPVERWRPWTGGGFRVELELEAGGRRLRVVRDFERGTVAIHDAGGREITSELVDGREESSVGQKLLGLDADEFEKCALVRQGELDLVVPGDEKARRASTLRARLENAADTHVGDTNASEAVRVLEEALRKHDAPELEFTGGVDTALERLEAKRGLLESELHTLERDIENAREPLERLAKLADDEEGHKDALRRLEAERQAGFAADVRRQLEENDRQRADLARLEDEAAELEAAANMPPDIEAQLRDAVARYEEAQRNLDTAEARRREELARDRAQIETELKGLRAYDNYGPEDADRCVALASELRRIASGDAAVRQQVFTLRDQLASLGYEPERIQFLTARFGGMPEDQQRLMRRQGDLNLAFQTEVATLEQERTLATETLRTVDAARSARRVPGWIATTFGIGAAIAGGVLLALKGVTLPGGLLAGGGVAIGIAGVVMLLIGARSQAAEREAAMRKLADAQRRLNHLRTQRAENEVGLAGLARVMGYRDAVDLMRHWNEYARMLEDSTPLMRAQELLTQSEAQRKLVLDQATPLMRALPGASPSSESLDKLAYDARRAVAARERIAELDGYSQHVAKDRAADEAAVATLRDRAVRILHSAGLTHDPNRSWSQHLADLDARATQRDRWRMLVDELVPYARKRLMPESEIEQRKRQLEMLLQGRESIAEPRAPHELEIEAKGVRARLEEMQRQRADLRLEVEEVSRKHAQQRPELEAQLERIGRALERTRAFKRSVEIARATIQQVATDTHRRWADFLNARVTELLERTGTRVSQLRFGEDLDFSLQLEGGPQVSHGKAQMQLSAGACDQLYLAVRLAVSEFLSRGGEPLPLLLDDVFATSDDERLRRGMRSLVEAFGSGHQIVAVTCHRGRHNDLRHLDPETFRNGMHWIDLRTPVSSRG